MGGYLIEIRINSLWSCAVEIADRGRRIAGDRAASLGQLSRMMTIYDDNVFRVFRVFRMMRIVMRMTRTTNNEKGPRG